MHRHRGETVHFHAHSHADEPREAHGFDHDHDHPHGIPVRSLLIGMMHGLAGSAALIVLTASTIGDPATGLGYVLLFGIGSILGMVALSAVMAAPLAWTARALTAANRLLQGVIGTATCGLGFFVLAESLGAL